MIEPAMIEAARTHASTAATWAIVIVAVLCLAFWLSMIYFANHQQVRDSGLTPLGPELLAAQASLQRLSAGHADEAQQGLAPAGADWRDLPEGARVPAQRDAEAPTEPAPAQQSAPPERAAQPAMPAQRTGEGDRAQRSGSADRDRR